jgi:hypothetical protein
MEYRFYMASNQEVSLAPSSSSWMNKPILMYAYLLWPQLNRTEILGSRRLPSSIAYEKVVPKDQKLYKFKLNLDSIHLSCSHFFMLECHALTFLAVEFFHIYA